MNTSLRTPKEFHIGCLSCHPVFLWPLCMDIHARQLRLHVLDCRFHSAIHQCPHFNAGPVTFRSLTHCSYNTIRQVYSLSNKMHVFFLNQQTNLHHQTPRWEAEQLWAWKHRKFFISHRLSIWLTLQYSTCSFLLHLPQLHLLHYRLPVLCKNDKTWPTKTHTNTHTFKPSELKAQRPLNRTFLPWECSVSVCFQPSTCSEECISECLTVLQSLFVVVLRRTPSSNVTLWQVPASCWPVSVLQLPLQEC